MIPAGDGIPPLPAAPVAGPAPCEAAAKAGRASTANGKPGAPRDNGHALRTGLRSPKCPPKAKGIDTMRYAFRRRAFEAWKAKNGTTTVPFFVECRIDTATRQHKNALLCEWLIRTTANLTAEAMTTLLDKSASFTESRDKALREIGINAESATPDPWAGIRTAIDAPASPKETAHA